MQVEKFNITQVEALAEKQRADAALQREAQLQAQIQSQNELLEKASKEKVRYTYLTRMGFGLLFGVISLGIILIVPQFIRWEWLDQHPNKLSLYSGAILIITSISWAIIDEKRRQWAIAPLVIGLIAAIVQVLGK